MPLIRRGEVAHQPIQIPRDCGSLRDSKRARWRAAFLIAIYVLVAIHIAHWKMTGRTLSPVEPSESMKTLELGYMNAGFILFVVLILSTLIFGRFFCGWACHVVALQDLCGWILKKLGIKPKPFRSRLLVFVPLFAAFYMFAWPTIARWLEGRAYPGITNHLQTEAFWETFPGPGIAILTFAVCGFLIVYLLGNKGFCTYGCPYGAIFYNADRLAPGKIRVTDACNGCGHCTATCTSNVRVHEEVKHYGMVVDPGCMKCMDCISVCPNDALYYGFGKPALAQKSIKAERLPDIAKPARKYDFTIWEEVAMAAVFAFAFYAFRGLYDSVPFLLSIGLSSITAFVVILAARLFYVPSVRLQHKTLRIKGATNGAGFALTVLAATLVAFITHSALWQYHYRAGQSLYNNAQAQKLPDETSVREALAHFEWCESKGFFPVATLEASLGSSMAYLGNLKDGLPHLRRAVELNPKLAGARYQLARTLQMSGDLEGAAREFKIVEKQDPSNLPAKHDLALVLASAGKVAESERILQEIAAKDPKNVELLLELASAQYKLADYPAAERTIRSALTNAPDSAAAHYNLGLVLLESSKAEAMKEFQKAVALDGSLIDPRAALAQTYSDEGRHAEAAKAFEGALALAPYDPGLLASWAHELKISGQIGGTIRRLIRSDPSDEPAWYHAAVLYKASGNASAANALYRRLAMRNPNLPSLQP